MKTKPPELWLDISSEKALSESLKALYYRWLDNKGDSKGESSWEFQARHLWPYLCEDFEFRRVDPDHSFEVP